jgi:hypothetical protein
MWNARWQLEQKFASPPVTDIFEIHDKTIGIIGIGRRRAANNLLDLLKGNPVEDCLNV